VKKAQFSKKEAVKFGFGIAKSNLLFFIGLLIIVFFVSAVASSLRGEAQKSALAYLVLSIVQYLVNIVIGMGLIRISLEFIGKAKPKIRDIVYYKPIVRYVLASIVTGIVVILGLVLLIIPGVILAIRLQYTTYLIVDKNLGPIEAIKKSWSVTRGNTWNLFFFGILLGLINILGMVCLLVGLFITIPLGMLATTFVYRKLLLQSEAA
jgi:uncharacterized membrane protein